jgi:hypothetical protein
VFVTRAGILRTTSLRIIKEYFEGAVPPSFELHRRNRIVHFGEINFQQTDASMCLTLVS